MRAAALLLATCALQALASPLEILSLARTLELGGSIARAQTTLIVSHASGNGEIEVSLGAQGLGKLAWLDATEQKSKKPLPVSQGRGDSYTLHVPADLASGNVTLSVSEVFVHASEPKPKQLQQSGEQQLFFWQGDLMGGFGAGREIADVKIRIKAPNSNVKSYSTPNGFTANKPSGSAAISYAGAISSGASEVVASVHYEQPEPVITFRTFSRHVEVSHWAANLAIKDDIELANDGPQLKGHFSRLAHQQQSMMRSSTGYNHVLSGLILALPPGARDPYFVDTVGNVSTSNFRPASAPASRFPSEARRARGASIELRPRYPIFGGWKYDFTVGYNLPLGDFLRKASGGRYHLAVPFLTTTKDTVVDAAAIRIVLPEGARDVQVHPPFAAEPRLTTHTTFLDTTGRPAVVISRAMCTDRHMVDIHVSYTYSTAALLQKPLAVATFAFVSFLIAIALRRVKWTIGSLEQVSRKLQ